LIIQDGGKIAAGAIAEAGRIMRENVPYLFGGNNEKGFDCSGFVQWCYSVGGYPALPKDRRVWTTTTLRLLGDPVTKGTELPGDLIFPDAGHVGIYIGPNQFVDAPETGKTVGLHDFTKYNGGQYSVRRLVTPYAPLDPVTGGIVDLAAGLINDTGILGPVAGAVSAGTALWNSLSGPIAWLSKGANWVRIGMIVGGGALVLFSIVYLEDHS